MNEDERSFSKAEPKRLQMPVSVGLGTELFNEVSA